MNVFELYGSLGLRTDDFSKGLKTAKGLFNSFGGELGASIGGVANILSGVVDTVGAFDNAVTSAFDTAVSTVTGGLEKIASAGVSFAESFMTTGLTFDSSISQVSATLLKSKEDFEATQVTVDGFSGSLRDLAKELGATTKFTATQAGEALNYMALAGYDAQTSAEMLPKVLDLAAAGAMDLGTASDMVTDAQTALGLSLDDTTILIDQMAKTASSSNTSVSQLGDAILSIGATGRMLKGGYTELNTALGVLADNGIKASEGGNELRRILIRLTAPGQDAAATMESLGFSAYDAQGNIKSLPDMFAELNAAMEGYTEQQKNVAISDIFGQYALAGANALLNTSADRWEKLTEKINDSEGAAKEMADIQLDNLHGKLTILKSAVEGLQISFSDLFSGKASEYVETFTSGLGDLTKQIDQGDFKGGFYALGNTIVDLINQGADDILNSEDEAKNFVDGLFVFVKQVASAAIDRGAEVLPVVTDLVLDLLQKGIDALTNIINDPEQFGKIKGTINLILTKIQAFLDENEDAFYDIFDAAWDVGIGAFLKVFEMRRKTTYRLIFRKFRQLFKDGLKKGAEEADDGEQHSLTKMIGENILKGISQGFVGGLPNFYSTLQTSLGNIIDFIAGYYKIESPSKVMRDKIGVNLARGIGIGFTDEMENVENDMKAILPTDLDYSSEIETPPQKSSFADTFIINFRVDSINGADEKTARLFASSMGEQLYTEIKRRKAAKA